MESAEHGPAETFEKPMATFLNEPIDISQLPSLDEERFLPLDPNYLRVKLIGDAIFVGIVLIAAVIAAVAITASSVSRLVPLGIGGVLILLTAIGAWLQRLEINHIGYLVRDKDFSFRRGVISRDVTTVPFARVQHVSIDRGPVQRRFGMATLQMRTAGGGLTVPGISEETATRLKALVVDRAGVAADDEQ